jgi:hypothetical protein
MSEWVRVEDALPPLGVPVWVFLPDLGQPVIGCRVESSTGWLWARCYRNFDWYWSCSERAWKAHCEVYDGYEPTHWQYLPQPPEVTP